MSIPKLFVIDTNYNNKSVKSKSQVFIERIVHERFAWRRIATVVSQRC